MAMRQTEAQRRHTERIKRANVLRQAAARVSGPAYVAPPKPSGYRLRGEPEGTNTAR